MNSLEWNAWVRFWFTNLTQSEMPDAVLDVIIQMTLDQFPSDTECRQKYEIVLAVLRYFIKEDAKGSSSSVSGGAIIERREKIGKREILEKYSSDGSTSSASSWEDLMEKVKDDPKGMIGCEVFPATGGDGAVTTGSVVIGGGNMYDAPYDSRRKRQAAATRSRCTNPWRPF
ncbi:hypothetical protein KUA24_67 [Vibrio phage HNL01]|nr:hypothetical protein KUA24_67 [Vibrio phage HNL01]